MRYTAALMRIAQSCCLASLVLLFLSAPGCATGSRSEGGAAGRSETAEDGAGSTCPAPRPGFPMRERLRGVAGCPNDIKTRPGPSYGYRVMFGCPDRGGSDTVVVVQGMGKKPFRQMLGPAPSTDDDGEEKVWRHFADNVRKSALVLSIHRSARIHACHGPGYAIELGIHSFRDIDDAVREIGDWLERMDSNGEVMLVLERQPNPVEP
jgi:hypothetical protein